MKLIAAIIAIGIAVFSTIWLRDLYLDRSNQIDVLKPLMLLKYPPQDYSETNPAVTTVHPGETVKVLRISYAKDFQAWRIQCPNGSEGWFIYDGENIRVK